MTTANRSTVVGVFENRDDAERAVDDLRSAGFTANEIGFAGHGEGQKQEGVSEDKAENFATGAAAGIIPGGVIGGVIGAVATGLIPGIGPIISAGILTGVLGGAAAGAATGGIIGGLTGLGVPEDEAKYYEGEFKSGRTLVTVKAEGRYDEASRILRSAGAYDIESRGATGTTNMTPGAYDQTRSAGPSTYASNQEMRNTHAPNRETPDGDTERMELREEQLRARTDTVETGEVRLGKDVVEEQRTIEVPRTREEVTIERNPVEGRPAATGPVGSGQEIRVPVHEEQVSVDKETVVREEVQLRKDQVQDTERVNETVRREEPRIERSDT
jgi:uncharacterized protein (TIGR02271 family)